MKRISPDRLHVSVQPTFWIVAVFALVIVPIKWVMAWFAAVFFHELGHYAAVRICSIPVYAISVKISGTYMHTGAMTDRQEIIISAMGPVASALLVLMAKWMPCTAICALFQLLFNLLLLPGFDGERMLFCLLRIILPRKYVTPVMRCAQTLLTVLLCGVMLYLRWWMLLFGMGTIFLLRRISVTFPCKQKKQIVQWSK